MILTVEEARAYAKDDVSSETQVEGFIATAEGYLKNGISEALDPSDPCIKQLCGYLVTDFDDNRGTSTAEDKGRRWLVTSLFTQMRAKYGGVS